MNSSNIKTAIAVSMAVLMTGCASVGGGVAGLTPPPIPYSYALSTSPSSTPTSPTPSTPTYTPPSPVSSINPTNPTTTLPPQPGTNAPFTFNPTSVAGRSYAYAGIVQTAPYTTSGGALASLSLKAADPNATATVIYDGTGLPSSLTIQSVNMSVNPSTVNQNQKTPVTFSGQTQPASTTAVQLDDGTTPQNSAAVLMSYTPSGGSNTTFQYQTFGPWSYDNGSTGGSLSWFSYGIPAVTMPTSGTATYTGIAAGYYFDNSGTLYATTANMSATANFAAPGATTLGSVTFSTTNTNMILASSPGGTTGTANSALDLSGTLTITGNNFTGPVTNSSTTSPMSGTATGLFYAAPPVTTGSNSGLTTTSAGGAAVGTPNEIGGTYAATGTGGSMLGAFGGKVQ